MSTLRAPTAAVVSVVAAIAACSSSKDATPSPTSSSTDRKELAVRAAQLDDSHSTPLKENGMEHEPNHLIRAELKSGWATQVFADRELVTLRSGSTSETARWSELRRISVITTDEGPRLTDVFIVLEGPTSRLVVPQDAKGNEGFIALLVTIEGFDHLSFTKAMGSADHAEFVGWTGAAVRFRDEPR